jgi:hypothetical protein
VTINEILTSTREREGLDNVFPILRRGRDLDKDTVQVRLGIRAVSYHNTGCIPEHTHETTVSEAVVVECPKDQGERCDNCILSAGETAVSVYEATVVRIGDPPLGLSIRP